MTRMFKPADHTEQTAFVGTHCNRCPRQLGCTLLADARPLDTADPDYPDELVIDDLGRPSCTAFAAAVPAGDDEALPPVTARPVPAPSAPAARPAAPRRADPIVYRGPLRGVTITTRRALDGSSETTTVRLQLAGGAR